MRQAPAIDGALIGGFLIDGADHRGGVLILDDAIHPWSGELGAPLLDLVKGAGREKVELVLLGLGRSWAPPPRPFRESLSGMNIGLEVMTTPEAIRLYNMLASDGRRLAAALAPL